MSVLIKGMEMPESCSGCAIRYEMFCPLRHRFIADEGRRKDCPLVELPPHGDLIDREPFIQFIKTHWDSYDQWFVDQLEARPTIIPAEEGE